MQRHKEVKFAGDCIDSFALTLNIDVRKTIGVSALFHENNLEIFIKCSNLMCDESHTVYIVHA